jgi:tRNA (guanine37-N1)-methyltransferase
VTYKVSVFSLLPEAFPGLLGHSIIGEAQQKGTWSLETINIRDHGQGRYRQVDDTPAGGGPGMVIKADVLGEAFKANIPPDDTRPRIVLAANGRRFTQQDARWIAQQEGLVLVCGRFEGIDARFAETHGFTEMSIGDYVLTGGEPAAHVMLDAILRLLPGVLGNAASETDESYENNLLEHPQYTRPRSYEGLNIPDVLLSGNHKAIDMWRQAKAIELTKDRRPDLWEQWQQAQT